MQWTDVFGSDVCTCRPYVAYGVEECVRAAQAGKTGIVSYNRKEGRALGEVVKFLVYSARRRDPAGDRHEAYFVGTNDVAGVCDLRFQAQAPDVLHGLGITRVHRWLSMSHLKSAALRSAGIAIVEHVALPEFMIPAQTHVEIQAKRAAGYFTGVGAGSLSRVK